MEHPPRWPRDPDPGTTTSAATTLPPYDPPPAPLTRDGETVRLIAEGDPEGLRRLLEDYGGRVLSVLRREFGDALSPIDIDGAVSQATQRVWESRASSFDPRRGPLPVWFLSISRNCARRIRGARSGLLTLPVEQMKRLEPSVQQIVEARDMLEHVRGCIARMQPMPRAVLLADLASGGRASTAELAAELGTTANAISVSRCTGRKELRRVLGDLGEEP